MKKSPSKRKSAAAKHRPAVARGIPVRVVDALVEAFGIEEATITLESHLVRDLGADSLDLVELAMALEQAYAISIGDEVLETWVSVADVLGTVKRGK